MCLMMSGFAYIGTVYIIRNGMSFSASKYFTIDMTLLWFSTI